MYDHFHFVNPYLNVFIKYFSIISLTAISLCIINFHINMLAVIPEMLPE